MRLRPGFVVLLAAGCAAWAGCAAGGPVDRAAGDRRPAPVKTGQYGGHRWRVDEDRLLWWDGKPYVPFGGFGIRPGNAFGLKDYNLWIDFDPFIGHPEYTRAKHRRDIARRLEGIQSAGGTCIVQLSMVLPHIPEGPRPGMTWRTPEGGIDGSRLADPGVKEAILRVWREYAPALRSGCIRAIVLWNEINVWRWPDTRTPEEYGRILGGYVDAAKAIFGDRPVCFKIAGTWNAAAAIAGAAHADGLGFDVWFRGAGDGRARREIRRALRLLRARERRPTWFFIAEGGRGRAEEGGTDDAGGDYWANWPPFRSREEARGILLAYAREGAKGFIYNGPRSEEGSPYRASYRWLGEMREEIARTMIATRRLPAPEPALAEARVIAIARAHPRVRRLLAGREGVRPRARWSERHRVWIVDFYAGDRRIGFASVSEEGEVLEAGGPEGDG